MMICKLIGHNLNFQFQDKLFCMRCGGFMKLDDSKPLFVEIVEGTSQFVEPVQFKDKFNKANKITDVLK